MSSAKHFTEVLIGGKVYTLSGFEGEEYLQKVSSYLNHKITECTNSDVGLKILKNFVEL